MVVAPGRGKSSVKEEFFLHRATPIYAWVPNELVLIFSGDKQVLIQAAAGGGTRKIEAGSSPTLACLSDEQIQALATLGARVEALYENPQDLEWAIDASGQIFLLQTRPITTLFPLPTQAPETSESLRVYLAFGVQQGTYHPFTPMGLSALRCLSSGFLMLIGSPLAGPSFVAEAAARKSVGKEVTLERNIRDRSEMERILETLALQVEYRLAKLGRAGRTQTLKVTGSTFELVTRASSREQGFHLAQEMLPILHTLLSGLLDGKRAVRLLGVTVSRLVSANEMRRAGQLITPSLWEDEHVQAEAGAASHAGRGRGTFRREMQEDVRLLLFLKDGTCSVINYRLDEISRPGIISVINTPLSSRASPFSRWSMAFVFHHPQ